MSNNLTLLSSAPKTPEETGSAPPKLTLLSTKPAQETQPAQQAPAASEESAPARLQLLSSATASDTKETPPAEPRSLSLLSSGSSAKSGVEPQPPTEVEVPAPVVPGQASASVAQAAPSQLQTAVAEEVLPIADAEVASNNGALAITFIAVIMAVGCAVAAAVFYLRSRSKSGGSTLVGQAPKTVTRQTTPKPQASDPHAVNAEIPSKPVPAVSDDPIIQFLNGEADDAAPQTESTPVAPSEPAATTVPPRKPAHPGADASHPAPPPKPGTRISSAPQAPNAPSGLKAPSKPKKRF